MADDKKKKEKPYSFVPGLIFLTGFVGIWVAALFNVRTFGLISTGVFFFGFVLSVVTERKENRRNRMSPSSPPKDSPEDLSSSLSRLEEALKNRKLETMSGDKLKLFRFYWKKRGGFTFNVRVVVAANEAEARKFFQENEKDLENQVREVTRGYFPADKVEEFVKGSLASDDFEVREYPFQKGIIS